MRLHDATLPTPELNLALDEALLNGTQLDGPGDTLRFWESPECFVVLGRSSRRAEEADLDACRAAGAPVLRRVSGGASIVTGPGCLMYGVALDLESRPELHDLTQAHRFVLGRIAGALQSIDPTVRVAGTSDLVVRRGDSLLKFSGNSLRKARGRLLYHGTLLYAFDLPLVGRLLRTAPRQPEYRALRDHGDFIANLTATREQLVTAIASAWEAEPAPLPGSVTDAAQELADQKYSRPEWNESR